MRGRILFLIIFAAAMFLLLLGRRQFAASHEARVANPASEMAASGWPWKAQKLEVPEARLLKRAGVLRLAPDLNATPLDVNPWVVPILQGEIRLQKPPLPYWCAAITYRLLGVSEFTSRLAPAILGLLTTFLLYDLARLLYGARITWIASLIWLTSYLVSEEYRLAMADPYLAFFTLLCVWSWARAAFAERRAGTARRSSMRRAVPALRAPAIAPLLLFYISLALGALAKGPLIFLHVIVPIALLHWCFRCRPPRSWLAHLIGLVLFLLIALPWPLAVLRQVPNAMQLWRYESVGEISGENQEGLRNWWYYVQSLPQVAVPWLAMWLMALIYPFLRKRWRIVFPFLWYAIIVLIFSAVGQKKLPYLLPMMPAQALMLAVAALPLLRLARRLRMRKLPGAIVLIQTCIGIAWSCSLPVLLWRVHDLKLVPLAISAAALMCAVIAFVEMRSVRPARWIVVQAIAYGLTVIVFCDYYLTDLNNARSPVALCRELESMVDGTHRAILESKVPEEVAFYLPLHPQTGSAPSRYLVVMDDQVGVDERAKHKRPFRSLSVEHFAGWVPDAKVIEAHRVEMKSAAGDARWKVYELTVRRQGFARR